MKKLCLICAGFLFLGIAELPIGFYTLLRIVVTIGAVAVVVMEYEEGFKFWVISFGLITIIFNPIIPIYLHDKSAWMSIDIICGILFTIKALLIKKQN